MSDRLSKAKEFAGEKWGELASAVGTQRQLRGLQRQIAQLVGERDRLMVEIGRKVYALYGRDKVRNADILPLCERIETIGEKIEALNDKVRELLQPKPRGELADTDVADDTELTDEAEEEEAPPAEAPGEEQTPEEPASPPEDET